MRRDACLLHSQPLRMQWIRRRRRKKRGGFHDAVSLKEGNCAFLCLSTAAKAGIEIIVLYNVKSSLTDNSI